MRKLAVCERIWSAVINSESATHTQQPRQPEVVLESKLDRVPVPILQQMPDIIASQHARKIPNCLLESTWIHKHPTGPT